MTILDRASLGAPAGDCRAIDLDAREWRDFAREVTAVRGRVLALWATPLQGSGGTLHAVAQAGGRTVLARLGLPKGTTAFPGIADIVPAADRMERAIFDLTGLRSDSADSRPWLRHAAWPADAHPLRDAVLPAPVASPVDDYAFVRVEGDGVHEIAVGPVHAGIIEPGHFRFSVVGEKVLRLEERLGYVHKGIERRFAEMPLPDGHRLAARVSGDSAVAYSWAYARAVEAMAAAQPPERVRWLRALALELERAANHIADLGALGNDGGFAFGLSQFMRLKERLLRATEAALGQRYLLDFVVPGGTRVDLSADGARALDHCARDLAVEIHALREIYEEHAGLRDRFAAAGTVTPELAARLGIVGFAGRASGQPLDLRLDRPETPYDTLGLHRAGQEAGDVLARVTVRFVEVAESLRLVREIATALPQGAHAVAVEPPAGPSQAVGLVEGWRGPVVIGLEAHGDRILRCHPQDPSWHNWPALEHAIIGNIVPDFPLINKSFNLSYSGHDL